MAKQQKKTKFLNPFSKGVTYEQFIKSIPKGKTVKEHLKGKCSQEQIDWIDTEINKFKKQ